MLSWSERLSLSSLNTYCGPASTLRCQLGFLLEGHSPQTQAIKASHTANSVIFKDSRSVRLWRERHHCLHRWAQRSPPWCWGLAEHKLVVYRDASLRPAAASRLRTLSIMLSELVDSHPKSTFLHCSHGWLCWPTLQRAERKVHKKEHNQSRTKIILCLVHINIC